MSFSSIKQSLANIDYSLKKAQTYLVLVPGLSLVIQKIQLTNAWLTIQNVPGNETGNWHQLPKNKAQIDIYTKKFVQILNSHLIGSIIQAIAIAAAVVFFVGNPLFCLLALPSCYEMVNSFTMWTTVEQETQLHDDGTCTVKFRGMVPAR